MEFVVMKSLKLQQYKSIEMITEANNAYFEECFRKVTSNNLDCNDTLRSLGQVFLKF